MSLESGVFTGLTSLTCMPSRNRLSSVNTHPKCNEFQLHHIYPTQSVFWSHIVDFHRAKQLLQCAACCNTDLDRYLYDNAITSIGYGAFSSLTRLLSLSFPQHIIQLPHKPNSMYQNRITEIPSDLFFDLTSLNCLKSYRYSEPHFSRSASSETPLQLPHLPRPSHVLHSPQPQLSLGSGAPLRNAVSRDYYAQINQLQQHHLPPAWHLLQQYLSCVSALTAAQYPSSSLPSHLPVLISTTTASALFH